MAWGERYEDGIEQRKRGSIGVVDLVDYDPPSIVFHIQCTY
jgi:hypothetical protein